MDVRIAELCQPSRTGTETPCKHYTSLSSIYNTFHVIYYGTEGRTKACVVLGWTKHLYLVTPEAISCSLMWAIATRLNPFLHLPLTTHQTPELNEVASHL